MKLLEVEGARAPVPDSWRRRRFTLTYRCRRCLRFVELSKRRLLERSGVNHWGTRGRVPSIIWSVGKANANCLPRFCYLSKFQAPDYWHYSAIKRTAYAGCNGDESDLDKNYTLHYWD